MYFALQDSFIGHIGGTLRKRYEKIHVPGRTRLTAAETTQKHSSAGGSLVETVETRNHEFEYRWRVVPLMPNIEFEIMHCISKLLIRRPECAIRTLK